MLLNLSQPQYLRLVELLALVQKQLPLIYLASDDFAVYQSEHEHIIQHIFKNAKKMHATDAVEFNAQSKEWQITEGLDDYVDSILHGLQKSNFFLELSLQIAARNALLAKANAKNLPDPQDLIREILAQQPDIFENLLATGLTHYEILDDAELRKRHPKIKTQKRLTQCQEYLAETLQSGLEMLDVDEVLNEISQQPSNINAGFSASEFDQAFKNILDNIDLSQELSAEFPVQKTANVPKTNVLSFPSQHQAVKTSKQALALAQNFITVKVSLNQSKPLVWRRLKLLDSLPLSALHPILQTCFGWENSHLHSFSSGKTHYEPQYQIDMDDFNLHETLDEAKVLLKDLLRKPKDKLLYEYDFGDGWELGIQVESIEPIEGPIDVKSLVNCITGKRAGALEDIGGVWALNDIVNAKENNQELPPHLEEDIQIQFYNPSLFSTEDLNARLKKTKLF